MYALRRTYFPLFDDLLVLLREDGAIDLRGATAATAEELIIQFSIPQLLKNLYQ